jgi:hypothetical protein
MSSRLHWRKAKALAMLANKRQWEREFDPIETSVTEIMTGEGYGIITESSLPQTSILTYIIVET